MRKAFLLFLVLFLAGCDLKLSNQPKSKVLARFDGTQVTELDFMKKVSGLPQALQSVAMERKKDLIEDIAAEHFLLKEAERRGLSREADVKDLIRTAQKKIVIAKLVEKEVDRKLMVTPDEISQYYDFHKEEFMTPLVFRASHILLKGEQEALSVKAALDQGADFEETARQRSSDTTAGRGGDLGYFQKGQFVAEFEEAVLQMKKNEVRGPVKTQFGWHIIRLDDRIEPRLREFQYVKSLVQERLTNERRSKLFKELVQKLKGNAKIEYDEQALAGTPAPAKS
jgi:peptidyl-prolyl cis-trans isomerase C